MSSEPIHIEDDNSIAEALDESSERPILLERHGVLYRVTAVEESAESSYDPEALRNAIDRVSGLFPDEEVDEMLDHVNERRLGVTQGEDTVAGQDYDPEAVRRATREATGALTGDVDKVLEELYAARRLGSRSLARP